VGSGRPLEAAFWCVELHACGQKEAKQARPLGLPQPVLGREVHVPVPPQSGASCRSLPFVFCLLSSCGLWRPSSAVLDISWSQFLFLLFFVILGVPLLFLGLTCPHNGVRAWVFVVVVCVGVLVLEQGLKWSAADAVLVRVLGTADPQKTPIF
jgi:hypothetical protein